MSPRRVVGPSMSPRNTWSGPLVGTKRPALAPPKGKTNDKFATSKLIERLEDEVAAPRSQSDNAKRVRTEEVAVAKVLVDHLAMFTE